MKAFISSEVQKTVSSIQELYRRWQDLLSNPKTAGKEEFNWTSNEIRNNIRSVEWDLEDLEETIGIVESNPTKFTLSPSEISSRKAFIADVKKTVQSIKDYINSSDAKAKVEKSNRQVSESCFDNPYIDSLFCVFLLKRLFFLMSANPLISSVVLFIL